MKRFAISLLLVTGCLGTMDEDESEVESASAPTTAQGVPGQGSTMQGSTMQGSTMQGSTMQGSTMQGSLLGNTVSYAQIQGTAIVFWRKVGKTWEQRFPNQICYWNATRTIRSSCTAYSLSASPILGSTWPTTFTKADGQTVTVNLRVDAVRTDPTTAMFPLNGSDYATATVVPRDVINCDNPDGCRPNRDIFNYDVRVIDVVDAAGNPEWLCPSGQTAIALAGTYSATGAFTPSSTAFTFACTNGTIAKCTRWGYRPYDRAIRDNDTSNTKVPLVDYHRACIRAAMADYCGLGKSMTKNGTLVDIYDYVASWQMGFIPRLDGFVYSNYDTVTAFAGESHFDRNGATYIIQARYEELQANPAWNINGTCPGLFYADQEFFDYNRVGEHYSPTVMIDSAPACAHSEFTVGKWLHYSCSNCTRFVSLPEACTSPTGPGWTQACADAAKASSRCTYEADKMSSHSECEVGIGLNRYDTGCTLQVCMMDASCCTRGTGMWAQKCVDRANATCRGGRESFTRGFCGTSIIAPPTTGSTF